MPLEFGRFLAVDGYIIFTDRDEFIYDEMLSHVPMAVHPNPKSVLIFGSGDGGVVEELLKYKQPIRQGRQDERNIKPKSAVAFGYRVA